MKKNLKYTHYHHHPPTPLPLEQHKQRQSQAIKLPPQPITLFAHSDQPPTKHVSLYTQLQKLQEIREDLRNCNKLKSRRRKVTIKVLIRKTIWLIRKAFNTYVMTMHCFIKKKLGVRSYVYIGCHLGKAKKSKAI